MKKFLVLYLAPVSVIEEWMKKSPEERKSEEDAMKTEWNAWMRERTASVKETAGAGKTKRVTKEGISDAKNDIMMFSMVEAESSEDAAKIFENHPHLGIPQASIEIMPVNYMPGME
ncbi:MAG: hypothetical protein PHT88_05275 [Candidatus Moranbacteria bacterium]|nr:hypothetical protein [Candidatus Moranbacteria bacterium]